MAQIIKKTKFMDRSIVTFAKIRTFWDPFPFTKFSWKLKKLSQLSQSPDIHIFSLKKGRNKWTNPLTWFLTINEQSWKNYCTKLQKNQCPEAYCVSEPIFFENIPRCRWNVLISIKRWTKKVARAVSFMIK